jgi:hypothetical protein
MKIFYWQVMLIRNNASNLILRLGQIQTNSVYSMNIGVELLGSYLKGFTFVIPDFIRDPDTLFSLITRSESFLLDSVSMLITARNEKEKN